MLLGRRKRVTTVNAKMPDARLGAQVPFATACAYGGGSLRFSSVTECLPSLALVLVGGMDDIRWSSHTAEGRWALGSLPETLAEERKE
jgi:hypothetical protein